MLALVACDKPAAQVGHEAPVSTVGEASVSASRKTPNEAGSETASLPPASSEATAQAGGSSASTTATTPDGTLVIRGLDGFARHMHGGPPAELGWFKVHVENRGSRARALAAGSIAFLGGRSCDAAPSEVRATLRAAGLLPDDGSLTESALSLRVAPGARFDVTVSFRPSVPAYYTSCDRFVFRAEFSVDGAPLTVLSETQVTRVEPIRKRP
jgi:hypothetical protein